MDAETELDSDSDSDSDAEDDSDPDLDCLRDAETSSRLNSFILDSPDSVLRYSCSVDISVEIES